MTASPTPATADLTALIFIDKRYRWQLRALLWGGQVLPSAELAELDFVHVASWSVIRQTWSDWDGHLLFVSNFSGDTIEYLSNFADILTSRIVRCFGRGEGFPGARPAPVFVEYVNSHTHPSSVYYSAYDRSSTKDVATAFRVFDAVTRLKASAVTSLPDAFATDYQRELDDVQARDAKRITTAWRFTLYYQALRHHYRIGSLSAMFSVLPEKEQTLCAALKAMSATVRLSQSIFTNVAGTHFARFVPLGLPNAGEPRDAPKYLIFSAQIDGDWRNYVERLRIAIDGGVVGATDMASVLACCTGFPGTDARLFHEWFDFYTVPAQLMVAEQPFADLQLVLSALDVSKDFMTFAQCHQKSDQATLLADFQRNFG